MQVCTLLQTDNHASTPAPSSGTITSCNHRLVGSFLISPVTSQMKPGISTTCLSKKSKGSPYLITERRVPELIVTMSYGRYFLPGLQLPLQPLRGLQFCCLVNRGTMGVNSLPKTVTRQRHDCDLIAGPSSPESSTLTTRLPRHPTCLSMSRLMDPFPLSNTWFLGPMSTHPNKMSISSSMCSMHAVSDHDICHLCKKGR